MMFGFCATLVAKVSTSQHSEQSLTIYLVLLISIRLHYEKKSQTSHSKVPRGSQTSEQEYEKEFLLRGLR